MICEITKCEKTEEKNEASGFIPIKSGPQAPPGNYQEDVTRARYVERRPARTVGRR